MTKRKSVLDYFLAHPKASNRKAAHDLGLTHDAIHSHKKKLRKANLLPAYDVTKEDWHIESEKPASSDIKQRLKELLKKQELHTIEGISDELNIGYSNAKAQVEELMSEGFNVRMDSDKIIAGGTIPKSAPLVLDIAKMSTGFYRFGLTGDNHLCSKYERLDVLNALYDEFEREGITTVFNTGNWIDGEARFNKHDLIEHGLDNQIDYWIKNYPQRKGITTRYITGDDHEGWYTQREGIDVGYYAQIRAERAGRMDLHYLGHMEADVILKSPDGVTKLRVLHPGGGSAYAISYTSQKIVESYTGEEKPHILVDGHYHKASYNYIRGVHVVQTGCTQDQTPFMRKKRLAAHLGGWIIEFAVDDNGAVTRFRQEWFPFYDNGYYLKWNYKWK